MIIDENPGDITMMIYPIKRHILDNRSPAPREFDADGTDTGVLFVTWPNATKMKLLKNMG